MKTTIIRKAIPVILIGIIALSTTMTALASTTPTVARTKAWDSINQTLGGVPESVRKIEYQGTILYLAPNVSDENFQTVIAAGAEAVRLKPPQNSNKFYTHTAYILWNSDKTTLLVHPIIFDFDNILEAVAITATTPTAAQQAPRTAMTAQEATEYMLSAEYADAVRTEFYRLLNAHRKANGLRELEVNLELQGYADIRAEEQRTRFGHTRPNGTAAGSGWHNSRNNLNTRYAENVIGVGALSPDPIETALSIFTSWKESPGHNRHMLYSFNANITMAFGITPKLESNGLVTSGATFATGF